MPTRLVRRAATVAALSLSLAACNAGAGPAVDASSATFTGRWAGATWVATANAVLIPGGAAGDTLYLGGSWPAGAPYPGQSLRLRLAPFRGAGSYPLASDAVELVELVGGDAVTSAYVGARPIAGVVEVASHANGLVQGTLAFRAVHQYGGTPFGTAPTFEDGRFRAAVHVHVPPAR
jgi:hypothetical protein